MPFLTYLDPASTDPADHVNRELDVAWVRNSLESFLRAPDKSRGRALAVLGERGIGKSTLVRAAIESLRETYAASTLFLFVDCRRIRNQRKVYHAIASAAVDQLGYRSDVDDAMKATARLLETIASMDTVEESVLYQRITRFKQAIKLSGARNLLKHLGISYDINIERSSERADKLEGSIHFDGTRLREAVVAFFEDLRAHQGYDAIIVLDNLDELDHEAIAEERDREALLAEIDALLGLASAPIGLVLTVRTYFASSLTRAIDGGNRVLHRMSDGDHVNIVRGRLAHERAEIRVAFDDQRCSDCIGRVAAAAPTPLALLKWFNYLAQNELHASPDIEDNLRGLARDQFATVPMAVLERVVGSFEQVGAAVPEDVLIAACGGNRSLFKLLLRYQIVLPVDFWHPTEFTLSPDLHFMWKPSVA